MQMDIVLLTSDLVELPLAKVHISGRSIREMRDRIGTGNDKSHDRIPKTA